jgi:Domain of unknown function (DUF4268)
MIEKISRVNLREIWKHEATDFTVWLVDNIEILNDIIGFELSNPEKEQSTGNFSVDIKAEDEAGSTVIIENQLEKSNHDHLGKIITYLSAFEAKKAIWIVSEPRQEHIGAINWLNEGENNCDFYLLKIEGIKIGKSNPAPLITKIVGPSIETKQIGKIKIEDSERHRLRLGFWTKLLEVSKAKHNLFISISPSKDTWISTTAGLRGVNYSYWVTKNGVRLQINIDAGKDSEEYNLKVFNTIKEHKESIESIIGFQLNWDEAKGNRMCAIRKQLEDGGYRNEEVEWESIAEKAIDKMILLEKATKPIIKKMK